MKRATKTKRTFIFGILEIFRSEIEIKLNSRFSVETTGLRNHQMRNGNDAAFELVALLFGSIDIYIKTNRVAGSRRNRRVNSVIIDNVEIDVVL